MATYMEEVRTKLGYESLKQKYYKQFPSVGGAGNFGVASLNELLECEEDDVVPKNPIMEKDAQIASLAAALEATQKEISDTNVLKESLNKANQEMKVMKRQANLMKNKIEFAKKMLEQNMGSNFQGETWCHQ